MAQIGNLIVVGTYEEFVLGYAIVPDDKDEKKPSLVQTFACHSHTASVRALALGGQHLASAGVDETIRLYDMSSQVEAGMLTHHNGTINALAFTENGTHLLSGGEDGTIAVVRTGSWFLEKKWASAHPSVTCISVHPSGKLALSVGTDNRLLTWNLVKGRVAYRTNLASRCRNGWGVGGALWSPSGDRYAVFMASHVEVYAVATAGVTHTIACSNRVSAVCFLQDDTILVGEDSGEASVYELQPNSDSESEGESLEVVRFQAHDRRVKCTKNLGPVEDGSRNAINFATAGGSGVICIWELEDGEVKKICEAKTGCRVTCMEIVNFSSLLPQNDNQSTKEKVPSKISVKESRANGAPAQFSKKKKLQVTVEEDHSEKSDGKRHEQLTRKQLSMKEKRSSEKEKIKKNMRKPYQRQQVSKNNSVRATTTAGKWKVSPM